MIQIETTLEKEGWIRLGEAQKLTQDLVLEIEEKVSPLLPGLLTIYINLKGIHAVDSASVNALRKMTTNFMNLGCAVRYSSVSESIDEIIGNLSISSDG